ncbi:MAG: MFS transporter [Chloroflexi bacterium]|nr:MFS transporter [Chloroflexota bacterium]
MECKTVSNGTQQNGLLAFLNYQVVILFVAVLAQAAVGTTSQAVPVLASFYKADLNLTSAEVGIFSGSLALGGIFVALAAGFVTDRLGVRPILLIGPLVVGGAVVALSFVPAFSFFLILALVAGAGHALTNPAIAKSILYWFPVNRRATAMGIKQTGIPLSGALGASILPALALAFDWRFAMAALGLTVAAAAVTAFLLYRNAPNVAHQRARKPPSLASIKAIFTNRNTWLICGLAAVLIGSQYCVVTYLILYLKGLQVSPTVAGGYLALIQMSGLVARVILGFLSDFGLGGRRKVVMVSCGLLAVAALLLTALLTSETPATILILIMAALGVSIIGWHGIWITMMAESSKVELAGTAVGFSSMLGHVGAVVVPALYGWIVDQSGGYAVAWYTLAGLVLAGSLLLLTFGKERTAVYCPRRLEGS